MGNTLELKRQVLMRTTLFGSLAVDDIDHLVTTSKILVLPANTTLFLKGAPGDRLYIVIKGVVRISSISEDGRETTLNLMSSGQVFGEIAAMDGGERTADATTLDAVELLVIERRDLLVFLNNNPQCCIRMLAACSERLRWISELLEDAYYLELPTRLAKRLHLLAQTFGQQSDDGIRISIRLSQKDIANHMNVTRESINKWLRIWGKKGFVSVEQGHIVIRDLSGLLAFRP
ncbi:MAG: Crp/Fnr family transcriptional regulator [Alphaproteobacteria bacterium]|nr:Crp/Fnr family transcriptional regulator [Alphaproteobacteria bacterium]